MYAGSANQVSDAAVSFALIYCLSVILSHCFLTVSSLFPLPYYEKEDLHYSQRLHIFFIVHVGVCVWVRACVYVCGYMLISKSKIYYLIFVCSQTNDVLASCLLFYLVCAEVTIATTCCVYSTLAKEKKKSKKKRNLEA